MLKLSKKLLFAIEAVLDIAYNSGSQPVQSREITQRQGIPRRYLEQVLQQLVRANVLTGVRGPRGGYLLARERRRITVGEITRVVAALDPGEPLTETESASELGRLVVRPLWTEVQERMMEELEKTTIEDVHATIGFVCLTEQLGDLVFARNVGRHRQGGTARTTNSGRYFHEHLSSARGQSSFCTGGRQCFRKSTSNTIACTGDYGHSIQ